MAYVGLTGGMNITGATNIGDGTLYGDGGSVPAGNSPDWWPGDPPTVSGTATVGSTLSCTNGTWAGTPPITFTYQWQRDTVNISSATNNTYTLVSADQGTSIRCVVTATNSIGSYFANSNPTVIPSAFAPGISPDYTTPPSISGNTTIGSVLTAATGTWIGDATITYAYQWQRNLTNISSATSSTYTLVSADEGTTIRCAVTATNSSGSWTANSNSKSIPVVPTGPTSLAVYMNSATGNSSFNVAENENPAQLAIQIWAYGSPNAVDVATWTLSGTGITTSDFTSATLYSGGTQANDTTTISSITSLVNTINLKTFSYNGNLSNLGVIYLGINADNISEGTEMLTVTVTCGGQTASEFFNIKDF